MIQCTHDYITAKIRIWKYFCTAIKLPAVEIHTNSGNRRNKRNSVCFLMCSLKWEYNGSQWGCLWFSNVGDRRHFWNKYWFANRSKFNPLPWFRNEFPKIPITLSSTSMVAEITREQPREADMDTRSLAGHTFIFLIIIDLQAAKMVNVWKYHWSSSLRLTRWLLSFYSARQPHPGVCFGSGNCSQNLPGVQNPNHTAG